MNTVRWRLKDILEKEGFQVKTTYGAMTRTKRHELGLSKTHANDAYSMGQFHPAHRAGEKRYRKVRRNNRILEKFYDAKYVDIRDGSIKSGSELSSGRTNRKIPRNNPGNERGYRGAKVSKGRRSIRRKRYGIRPGDILCIKGKRIVCGGVNNEGKNVTYHAPKEIPKEETSPVKNKKTGESLPVKEGGFILLNSEDVHLVRPVGESSCSLLSMIFSLEYIKMFRNSVDGILFDLESDKEVKQKINSLLGEIANSFENKSSYNSLLQIAYVNHIYYLILEHCVCYKRLPASSGLPKRDFSYAKTAMDWAITQGIMSGKGGNRLDPTGKATRAEFAVMLKKLLQ